MRKLRRILAGIDGPGKRALPAGEFLHPVPLLALVVLALNDHVLKGSGWLPGAVTGKISDAAGFVFFPVLCTAAVDTLLWGVARLGAPVDFSLRWWKLWAAAAGTAALMAAIKLSVTAADFVADALGAVGFASVIVADPTDLWALPALAVPLWIGRNEIQRVPLGRLEVLERAWKRDRVPAASGLGDVPGCGELATQLDHYFETGDPSGARAALDELRSTR